MTATSQYPAADVGLRLIKPKDELLPPPEPSLGRRAFRAFFRFLIAVGVGIGGTLAWQVHGDAARQMIATAYPERLGWIAPPAAPAPESAPAALASAAPPAPSVDEEHLKAMAVDLAAMRQSVEQLAGQVASGQRQVSDEIAKLGDEVGKLQAHGAGRPEQDPAPATAATGGRPGA